MDLTIASLSAIAALVAAGAAVCSAVAARHAHRAAKTLTAIEQDRWHADLTPQFEVTLSQASTGDRAVLRVALVGPVSLDRVDEMTLAIRDDLRDRSSALAGGPTAEQIARQIWGPYRFVPGVDGADETGRQVSPVKLLLGDERPFSLERTRPPPWSNGSEWWSQQYRRSPIQLTLDCWRAGYDRWTIPAGQVPYERGVE